VLREQRVTSHSYLCLVLLLSRKIKPFLDYGVCSEREYVTDMSNRYSEPIPDITVSIPSFSELPRLDYKRFAMGVSRDGQLNSGREAIRHAPHISCVNIRALEDHPGHHSQGHHEDSHVYHRYTYLQTPQPEPVSWKSSIVSSLPYTKSHLQSHLSLRNSLWNPAQA
jgi:hypothetical protein